MPLPIRTIGTNDLLGVHLPSGDLNALVHAPSGGGAYSAGIGIDPPSLAAGTITNTGTIVQPNETGTNHGIGVVFRAGDAGSVSSAGYHAAAAGIYAGGITAAGTIGHALVLGGQGVVYGGEAYGTNIAAYVQGGIGAAKGGNARLGAGTYPIATGGIAGGGGGYVDGTQAIGGAAYLRAGQPFNAAVTNFGGAVELIASYGEQYGGTVTIASGGAGSAGIAGNITLSLGSGASFGLLIANSLPSVDPATTGAFYVDPITHNVKWK